MQEGTITYILMLSWDSLSCLNGGDTLVGNRNVMFCTSRTANPYDLQIDARFHRCFSGREA